jgi:hypothetical protein
MWLFSAKDSFRQDPSFPLDGLVIPIKPLFYNGLISITGNSASWHRGGNGNAGPVMFLVVQFAGQ